MNAWPASSSPPKKRSPSPSRLASSHVIQMSERDSPRGATAARRSWMCRSPACVGPKPTRKPSRSHAVDTGRHHVGQRRRRREEEIGVDEEVQLRQRRARHARVRLREQQVGAESHHPPHGVRRTVQDGAIQVDAGRPAQARRAQRPLGEAQRLRALGLGEQRKRREVIGGRPRGPDITTGRVPATGQRVEQRHRAHGLAGVGVLLEPGPVEVRHRTALPEQARASRRSAGRAHR